jgi:ribosome-associated protein
MQKIQISTEFIKLDQFLKWAGIADSGTIAKTIIQSGDVRINGEVAHERGKKLHKGDKVEVVDVDTFEII